MLWIVKGSSSYLITSCNIAENNGEFQLWVERSNGKSLKIEQSADEQEIKTIKEAIDYAIENNEQALRL